MSLSQALTAMQAGDTLKLLDDVERYSQIAIEQDAVIDLNGQTLTLYYADTTLSDTATYAITLTGASLTIQMLRITRTEELILHMQV